MKAVAASPVLHHARALGRAFLGAGRALRRGRTWFLLIAFGVCLPWLVFLGMFHLDSLDSVKAFDPLGTVRRLTPRIAVEAALAVALLALLVSVLEGRSNVSLRKLHSSAKRLVVAAAAIAGAKLASASTMLLRWEDPLADLIGGDSPTPLFDVAFFLVKAWVAASVIAAMRDGGGWPWRARHLVVAAALLMLGPRAIWVVVGPMSDWQGLFERLLDDDWDWIPPLWWAVARLGECLVSLVVLEYLRIEPPPAPAEAAP